jgi:AcrR family transcriptional regulator
MGRPSRPLLSREGIAVAALAIIDEDGAEALSTRRLAAVLGVSSPSLYSHFATRDGIVAAVVERVMSTVEPDLDRLAPDRTPPQDWRSYLREWARAYVRVLARHPNAVELIVRSPIRARASLRAFDDVFACLLQAGFGPREAADMVLAVDCYVIGSALDRAGRGFPEPPDAYRRGHPSLALVLAEVGYRSTDDTFETGLAALLDGFARPLGVR